MRHTFGFLLGVILTPVLLYGTGWGYAQAAASFDPLSGVVSDRTRIYGAFALLAAVGIVMGVIAVARWASPFASLIPALVLIAWSGYYFASPEAAFDLIEQAPPSGVLDAGLRTLLGTGMFALMGFALLVPSWAPRRWGGGEEEYRESEYF